MLIRLMNEGKTPREIAVVLGRTHEAVRTKTFQVRNDDFVIPSEKPSPIVIVRMIHEVPRNGLYKRAQVALGNRHKYHTKLGNFVDNSRVTLQEMIRISGVENE